MQVNKIEPITFDMIYKVLTSTKVSEAQKTQFMRNNSIQVAKIMETKINDADFTNLIKSRKIQKFRPLKNSYTKIGDKIILAKALNITPAEVPNYVKNVSQALDTIKKVKDLPESTIDLIKTYVYRHGTKDELVAFLDYELLKAKDKTKYLYRTLEYYQGGVADYFIRPIHRMDNKTLIKIFQVINKHIKIAEKNGDFDGVHSKKLAKWALIKIYKIQNNSKLINAIKTYNVLK